MPELPEVENIRRELLPRLRGTKILKVTVRMPKLVSGKGNIRVASEKKKREFITALRGETFGGVSRRGKNIMLEMKSGKIILVHLKMSGQFIFLPPGAASGLPDKHTHITFALQNGALHYRDPRRFGYALYYPSRADLDASGHFDTMGTDPFDARFTRANFSRALRATRGRLKSALLGQRIVAGLGNIYADEICFRAGIRPAREARSLTAEEAGKLFRAMKTILVNAISLGGSSVRTYIRPDGSRGAYTQKHLVYGRGGKPCMRCKNPLIAIFQERTTVFCGTCQR